MSHLIHVPIHVYDFNIIIFCIYIYTTDTRTKTRHDMHIRIIRFYWYAIHQEQLSCQNIKHLLVKLSSAKRRKQT